MNRLRNRLFGYTDRSNHGQYEYERRGLLTGHAILHLRRGVVAVPLDVGEAARLLVLEEKARVWLRRVELEPEDVARMERAAQKQGPAERPRSGVKRTARKRRKSR